MSGVVKEVNEKPLIKNNDVVLIFYGGIGTA